MTKTPARTARADDSLSGVERWLRSPIRFAALVVGAVVFATAATSLGEIELRRAWGGVANESDVVARTGVIWTAWAVVAPPLVALAAVLARRVRPLPLVFVAHLPIAAALGSGFLVLEIELTEWVQGEERTERYRGFIEWMESGGDPERRPPRGRGRDRDRDRGEDRDGDATGGPLAERASGSAPGTETETDPDRSRDSRGSRRDRRGRGPRSNSSYGVATGDLLADFERRWPLRVPRYALIYFALIGIGLGIRWFLVGRDREREALALERRASQLEADLAEAKLSALQGQLHPHFLFNALHSIGGLIRTDKPAEALTALASIGDLLRTSLDAGGEQFVPLGREVELIERYLAVEKLRLGDRLHITFDVPDQLAEAEVPAFIAQPLAENAVKHAIAPRTGGGSITIRARADGANHLVIDVEDDGPGFAPDDREGVGLPHIRSRLAALFDDDASLEMTTLPDGGTRARLRLPLDDLATEDAA